MGRGKEMLTEDQGAMEWRERGQTSGWPGLGGGLRVPCPTHSQESLPRSPPAALWMETLSRCEHVGGSRCTAGTLHLHALAGGVDEQQP